jgi:hypothetical protein
MSKSETTLVSGTVKISKKTARAHINAIMLLITCAAMPDTLQLWLITKPIKFINYLLKLIKKNFIKILA